MSRFFVGSDAVDGDKIYIRGEDARHIARALRMAEGDFVTVSDGEGNVYSCRLIKIRDEECVCEVRERKNSDSEQPLKIALYMGYPKGDKLEFVIQKATELGASEILPFESSRCIKRPKADKAEKKDARLARIAEEAAKQCGRCAVPKVHSPLDFKSMVKEAAKAALPLFCYEEEGGVSLKSAIEAKKEFDTVSVVIGPEGGFSPEEAEYARKCGLISVGLGKRILRCETAPLYVLSVLSYLAEL